MFIFTKKLFIFICLLIIKKIFLLHFYSNFVNGLEEIGALVAETDVCNHVSWRFQPPLGHKFIQVRCDDLINKSFN